MSTFNRSNQRRLSSGLGIIALSLLGWLVSAAAAGQQAAPAVFSQADEILHQMSEMTGLPIKAPLNKQVVSRPEIEKYLIQNLHEESSPAEIHAQEALVRVLGLVPPDFNLEKFLISFYTEQGAGFYDPKRKTMFIADWVPAELQPMTLSHELTHALQDQNWNLENFLRSVRNDDDAASARQAFVEGYATAAMVQQIAGGADLGQMPSFEPLIEGLIPEKSSESPVFSRAPYFFRKQALFPYVQGMGFIQAGLRLGGWKNLNASFEHPPDATQQIFHPQTYFGRTITPKVTLNRPPLLEGQSGLRFLTENTLGELGIYCLLGQLISEEEAKAVSPSWAGDRYVLYEQAGGNTYTLVARTRWVSAEAAMGFFRDYYTILGHKYPGLSTDPPSGPDLFVGTAANGRGLLLRKGNECLWVEGAPAAKTDALLAWLRAL